MPPTIATVRQFGSKVEATLGTEESLVAADYAGVHSDLSHAFEVGEYERGQQRASLSGTPGVPGDRMIMISGAVEFTGGSIAAGSAADPELRACGMRRDAARVIAVGTITNPTGFRVGTIFGNNASQASATKTGMILAVLSGPTRLVYLPLTGSFTSGDNLTGYDSPTASCAASGSPSDTGWVYRFQTQADAVVNPSITAEIREGGQRVTLVGGRATGRVMFNHNQPPKLSFEVRGPAVLDANGDFRTGTLVSGVPGIGANPRPFNRASIEIDGVTPVLTSIEIDLGVTVSPRRTSAANDLVSSGMLAPEITARAPAVTFNPEHDVSGFLHARRLSDGATFAVRVSHGLITDPHGMLVVYAPAAQVRSPRSPSEREGVRITEVTARLTDPAGADGELVIAQLFAA